MHSLAAFHVLLDSMAHGNLKHIDKLKRLQKRASRVITSSGYETTIMDKIYGKNGILVPFPQYQCCLRQYACFYARI